MTREEIFKLEESNKQERLRYEQQKAKQRNQELMLRSAINIAVSINTINSLMLLSGIHNASR